MDDCLRVFNRQSAPLVVFVLITVLAVLVDASRGAESEADKSAFSFLNPTPTNLLRPMTIDGPGATESPFTVDAGHFQLEMVAFEYSSYKNSSDGEEFRLDRWSVGPMTLKLGLFNPVDLQLVLEPYHHIYEREDGFRETRTGFGDTTLRVKYNLWGNDEGATALALIPFVSFPTGDGGVASRSVQGGLLLPFNLTLPYDFDLGLTSGFATAENLFNRDRHVEFRTSIALYHELFWDFEGYVEFSSTVSTERHSEWIGVFDFGFTYWFTENLLANAGVSRGLTDGADDWLAFVGMAWRW